MLIAEFTILVVIDNVLSVVLLRGCTTMGF